MKFYYILFNLFALSTNALSFNKIYKYNYRDTPIKLYKSQYSTNCKNIVFYSGGNSVIPPEIYNNFLKTLAQSNYNIYCLTNREEDNEILFNDLHDSEYETILIGHSSGCVNAIEEANKNKFIKKMIMMDPVNNKNIFNINPIPFINNKKNNLQLKYVNKILLLNAEKSYDWSFYPTFNIPFIPAFAMNENKIKELNTDLDVKIVKAKEYGHSDILDSMYSDFMHKTISKGNQNRSEEVMFNYYLWIKEQIDEFITPDKLSSAIVKTNDIIL